MEYLEDMDLLNQELIKRQSDPKYLVDYFSSNNHNKNDKQNGLVYINPLQVMQIFYSGDCGYYHDKVASEIEEQFFKNQVQSRLFLRCFRRSTKNCLIDTFGWDLCLRDSDIKIKSITRDMYNLASTIQDYVIAMSKAQGFEIDEDFCTLLDDAIEYNKIEIVDDNFGFKPEEIYGQTLKEYSKGFQDIVKSPIESDIHFGRESLDDDSR